MERKLQVIKHILGARTEGTVQRSYGIGWAPSNVALCKYWGKRDLELNLPLTTSLSISLGYKGALTKVSLNEHADCYRVNQVEVNASSAFARRLRSFLDLFRKQGSFYTVEAMTNVPIAAGLASSACGFAALVLALDNLYGWQLSGSELSILARLGSGSACRSLFEGFVEWPMGTSPDGMDSYGRPLELTWPELRVGLLAFSAQPKTISSREAMRITVNTSSWYSNWRQQAAQDLVLLKAALANRDFARLGKVAEENAVGMHRAMQTAQPAIEYSLPETRQAIEQLRALRAQGLPIFFTQDAGPNIQLLFLEQEAAAVQLAFPIVEVIAPFAALQSERLVLVDEQDNEIGVDEKLSVHRQGSRHRAFSVVILRERAGVLELLLQQRSSTKYHSANLWSNACCGHPRLGEEIVAAGERRLQEELGRSLQLRWLCKFQYRALLAGTELIEHEVDHLLIGFGDYEAARFNPAEVQACRWMSLPALQRDLSLRPQSYTAWLPHVLEQLLANFSRIYE